MVSGWWLNRNENPRVHYKTRPIIQQVSVWTTSLNCRNFPSLVWSMDVFCRFRRCVVSHNNSSAVLNMTSRIWSNRTFLPEVSLAVTKASLRCCTYYCWLRLILSTFICLSDEWCCLLAGRGGLHVGLGYCMHDVARPSAALPDGHRSYTRLLAACSFPEAADTINQPPCSKPPGTDWLNAPCTTARSQSARSSRSHAVRCPVR